MVLSEKNSANIKNGQRSRGPSPNGNVGPSPASPIDDEGGEYHFILIFLNYSLKYKK